MLYNYLLRHEDVWRRGGIAPPFLISALNDYVTSFTTTLLYTAEKSPGTICVGGCVETRSELVAVGYRKILYSYWNRTAVVKPIAYYYTD
jgi:hypothetical protein